jgi:cell division protein FtsZ
VIREKVDADANIIVGSTLDEALAGAMRVSVVATGIDASTNSLDVPVPRRRMAQPLNQPARIEEAEQAPAAVPAPVAAEQREEPARYEDEEPDFFADYEARRQAAQAAAPQPQPQPQARYQEEAADDLPPPAYRPQPQAVEPAPQADPEEFVAPRAAAPGTPSPEALARLRAAVHKAPGGVARAQPQEAPRGAERGEPAVERPRFGINSLIGRMTGQPGEGQQAQRPAQQAPRAVPPVSGQQPQRRAAQPRPQPEDEAEMSPEQERIEIPAFLRRQAN